MLGMAAVKVVVVHGALIPALGLGTFCLKGDVARRIVGYALDIGYRHIDTAQEYRNEVEIGDAISSSSVRREDIWLTTKVWPDHFRDGDLQRSVEESARRLRTEPDLVLLHWPNPRIPLRETMHALNDAKRKGLVQHIGVSNFTMALMRKALRLTREPLLVNQVEYHPYLSQQVMLDALRQSGMALVAYSPLALGRVFRDPTLRSIGERYGRSAGQVALRWLLQQDGVIAIPRSASEAHAASNLEIFDFRLTSSDVAKISALASPKGRLVDPFPLAPVWDDLHAVERARRNVARVVRPVAARVRRLFG
jgi:2,5-diketo-D-gluconate reductase B